MEKSHGINCPDLKMPSWLTLRPTSRSIVSSGTMMGFEVTKADARLLMVTVQKRNMLLAHSVGKARVPSSGGPEGASHFSQLMYFSSFPMEGTFMHLTNIY